jgi:hypothetical protein
MPSVMKLRRVTKELNREGDKAMNMIWRYLCARHLSSRFIARPLVGGQGQVSFTKAIWDHFASDKIEVLIMGGYDENYNYLNSTFKMVMDKHGNIRFEDSMPMLVDRAYQDTVYHQGEVFSISTGETPVASIGTMERLDTLSQTRTMLRSNLPHPLYNTSAAILNNKLFVIGGKYRDAASNEYLKSNMMYEFEQHADEADQGTWRLHEARLNTARYDTSCAVYQGKLYICGGYDGNYKLSSVEVFDPAIGTWQNAGKMTNARTYFSLFVFDDELYAVGGDGYDDNITIEKLSKQTGEWELVTDLEENRWGCASALVGSKIFLFGGYNGEIISTFDIFDLITKKWASKTIGGKYYEASKRQMPRIFSDGNAVVITPGAESKKWTPLNLVKLEERNYRPVRFAPITGNVMEEENV